MTSSKPGFDHLDGAGAATARLAGRPAMAVSASLGGAILLSWAVLAAMAAGAAQRGLAAELGPGGGLLRNLPELALPAFLERFIGLCVGPALAGLGLEAFAALWAMWVLMAMAMMLPAAAPMVRTYCEIADTAAARGMGAVHPLVLVAGYLGVWALAGAGFAAAGIAIAALTQAAPAAPVTGIAGAVVLSMAGLYQFSGLKDACLRKCRSPFAVLFANWSTRPGAILALGARQGVWCLGCCWALMLVMFAVGTMNLFWMALIGLLAIAERRIGGVTVPRAAGSILLVWAGALLLVSW